tara:strand:+ start:113 stop:976 length:864 start_codon:yes stop_codon:yes gene_type:complete
MPGKKRKADKKAGFGQGSGSTLVDASIAADPLRNLPQIVKIELRKMLGKKDGGLAEAIEKVKAQEMENGGKAKKVKQEEFPDPEMRTMEFSIDMIPEKFRDSFRKKYMKDMRQQFEKKAEGGPIKRRPTMASARGPRRMGFLGQAVDEFIETMEPFQGTVRKGETLRNVDGKTMVVRRVPNPNFRANTISDADRSLMRNIMGEQGRTISDADRQMMMQMMSARRMEDGGKVPAKFKGFSKLPEDVQEQMNPTLAKKFKKGGVVKMGKGGGVCKGMGIARAGGKFKLR